MKKKSIISKNYLENVPQRACIKYTEDTEGIVTLEIENKGIINKIAQKLLKKPKTTYIHLDEFGSFVWKNIDGKKSIIHIGKDVEEKFGNKANPLYERLAKYFQILESYAFITFKTTQSPE